MQDVTLVRDHAEMQSIPPTHARAIMGVDNLVLFPGSQGSWAFCGVGTRWQPSEELGQCHPSPHGTFSHQDGAHMQLLALCRLGLPQQLRQQPALLPSKKWASGPE